MDDSSYRRDTTSDVRLIERAIRERWPIQDDWRRGVIARLIRVIGDAKASHRAVISAARALFAADALNLQQLAIDAGRESAPANHHHLHLHGEHGETVQRLRDITSHLTQEELRDAIETIRRLRDTPGDNRDACDARDADVDSTA